MAVIINEFEVMPERPDESPAATPEDRQQAAAEAMTPDELEQVLRQVRERLERVRAH